MLIILIVKTRPHRGHRATVTGVWGSGAAQQLGASIASIESPMQILGNRWVSETGRHCCMSDERRHAGNRRDDSVAENRADLPSLDKGAIERKRQAL
ncbi:hypothetical protein PspCFBP13509_23980 [Pseudomonas sp. CFBP13509]|nr:hypothetical protein PspCFBP13509_23980 [Pseudomonas sp. CFBP13509]